MAAKRFARLGLALTFLPLILAGQWCLAWRDVKIVDLALSDSGVFAVVSVGRWHQNEIRELSTDLNTSQTLFKPLDNLQTIICNVDGSVVIALSQDTLTAYDTGRRNIRWKSSFGNQVAKLDWFLSNQQRYLIVVATPQRFPPSPVEMTSLQVFDLQTGDRLADIHERFAIEQVYTRADVIGYVTESGEARRLEQETNWKPFPTDPAEIAAEDLEWDTHRVSGFDRNYGSTARIEASSRSKNVTSSGNVSNRGRIIYLTDLASGEHYSRRLSLDPAVASMALVAPAVVTAVWFACLGWLGKASSGKASNLVLHYASGIGLLVLMMTDWREFSAAGYLDSQQTVKLLSVLGPVIIAAVFSTTMLVRRGLHLWAVIFLGCVFPVIFPAIILGLALRQCQFGVSQDGRPLSNKSDSVLELRRFGIGGMLLATAGIATLFGIGWQTLTPAPIGTLAAIALVVGLWISRLTAIAFLLLSLCVIAIIVLGCGDTIYRIHDAWRIAPLMFILTACFAAQHGFIVRRVNFK